MTKGIFVPKGLETDPPKDETLEQEGKVLYYQRDSFDMNLIPHIRVLPPSGGESLKAWGNIGLSSGNQSWIIDAMSHPHIKTLGMKDAKDAAMYLDMVHRIIIQFKTDPRAHFMDLFRSIYLIEPKPETPAEV